MAMRAHRGVTSFAVAGGLVLAACGGGANVPSAESVGDPYAERAVCDSECRLAQRCGRSEATTCAARCAALAPRQPPLWSAAYAAAHARCAETTCASSGYEDCVHAWRVAQPRTNAVQKCFDQIPPKVPDGWGIVMMKMCFSYVGLAPQADAYAADCIRQRGMDKCLPPFDERSR